MTVNIELQIESYKLTFRYVFVYYLINDKPKTLKLSRLEVEEWIEQNDRLEYILDYPENGEHVQIQEKIDIGEYWECGWESIHRDLKDFITEYFAK
jgi:hypothetical protein